MPFKSLFDSNGRFKREIVRLFQPINTPRHKSENVLKHIVAFDLEDWQATGEVRCLSVCHRFERKGVINYQKSTIFTSNTGKLIDFLFEAMEGRFAVGYFFKHDAMMILKQFICSRPLVEMQKHYLAHDNLEEGTIEEERAENKPLTITYGNKVYEVTEVEGSCITIRRIRYSKKGKLHSSTVQIWDIWKHLGGSLDENCARYCKLKDGRPMTKENLGYPDPPDKNFDGMPDSWIQGRCEQDAMMTAELCAWLLTQIKQITGGFIPMLFYSKAYVSGEYYIKQQLGEGKDYLLRPVAFMTTPLQQTLRILEFFMRANKGAIVVCKFRGLIYPSKDKRIKQYDNNSLYPSAMKKLPDCYHGEWRDAQVINGDSKGLHDDHVFYAVYECEHAFDGFEAIKFRGLNYFPQTTEVYRDFLTKQEILDLKARGIPVNIIAGVEFWHDDSPIEYPFKDYIIKLYQLKEYYGETLADGKKRDEGLYNIVKIFQNGLFGKTLEHRIRTGKIFAPFYGTYILALSRLEIKRFALKYFKVIFDISTDSVLGIRNNVPIESELGSALGQYKDVTPKRPFILLGSGQRLVCDEESKEWYLEKMRGIMATDNEGKTIRSKIYWLPEHKDFITSLHLTDDELLRLKQGFMVVFERPRKRRESLRSGRPEEIGRWMPDRKIIRLDDSKHDWPDFTLQALIDGKQYRAFPKEDMWVRWIQSEKNPATNFDISGNNLDVPAADLKNKLTYWWLKHRKHLKPEQQKALFQKLPWMFKVIPQKYSYQESVESCYTILRDVVLKVSAVDTSGLICSFPTGAQYEQEFAPLSLLVRYYELARHERRSQVYTHQKGS